MRYDKRLASRILSLIAALAAVPAWAGGVAIVNTVVSDNGDGDGFADTRETVSVKLNVKNTSGVALSDVKLRIAPRPPVLVCVTVPEISIGDLAVDETRLTDQAFVFTVADVDRGGSGLTALDDLSITFDVLATSLSVSQPAEPPELTLDLDLDVAGGSGPTTFFESFEDNTLGTFEVDNIDAGKFSLEASDGYRCQYNDPDWPYSNDYGQGAALDCYMGASVAHADATFWGLSGPGFSPLGGRAFTGFHSLFYGIDLGPPENWTTPLGNLEAARTAQPIHLGWDQVQPELSIKHQVSLADDRCTIVDYTLSYDRSVVMAQLADGLGNGVGPWVKLFAHQNGYEQQNDPKVLQCGFDPTDDGSTEDDYFDPGGPQPRYGPSSTCFPGKAYTNSGETSSPFSPSGVGDADGPALAGAWGIGTWIESRFDLSRFRGRSVRVRFLASTIKAADGVKNWEEAFGWNPIACDDGWWIDDVTLTGALTSSADAEVDGKNNGGLPGPPTADGDGDGHYDVCDNCAAQGNDQLDQDFDGLGDPCDPCPTELVNVDPDGDKVCSTDNCPTAANPEQVDADHDGFGPPCDCFDAYAGTYPGAPEKNDTLDNQCPGDAGYGIKDEISGTFGFFDPANKNRLSWPAQVGAGFYQVVRGNNATFTVGCTTLPQTFQTFIVDAPLVPSGQVRFYLVRALTPNKGSWGQSSAGVETVVPCAP